MGHNVPATEDQGRCGAAHDSGTVGDMASQGARDVIVVGVDGSSGADAALDHALTAGLERGCGVEVVTGWLWVGSSGAQSPTSSSRGALRCSVSRTACWRGQQRGSAPCPRSPRPSSTTTPAGCSSRRAEGATALVVGAGSLGATANKMLGSVSEYCVRHSPVPVVVVPEPERVRRRHTVADVITLARTS